MRYVREAYSGMSPTLTETAVGKDVVDASGETVGIVSEVDDGTAYINVDPHLSDRLLAKFNWGHASEDDYPVDASDVAAVDRNRITLLDDL